MDPFGWSSEGQAKAQEDTENGNVLGAAFNTAGSILTSLPGMILGFPLEIAPKATEAITGTPVTEANFEGTKIAPYKLSDEQRAGAG